MVELVEITPEYIKLVTCGMTQIMYVDGTYWCDNPDHWPEGQLGLWEFRDDGYMWWNLPWHMDSKKWYQWRTSSINPEDSLDNSVMVEEMIKNWLLELSIFKKD